MNTEAANPTLENTLSASAAHGLLDADSLPHAITPDTTVPVSLLMSTHLAVSVHLRLEGPGHVEEQAMVIPRRECIGERPRLQALLRGVSSLTMRLHQRAMDRVLPLRVWVQIADRWVPLLTRATA